MKNKLNILIGFILAISLVSVESFADGKKSYYEVNITNITRGQTFTPILVLTHKRGVTLFTPGSPASAELAMLAEGGATDPLEMRMSMNPNVGDIMASGGPTLPGETTIVTIPYGRGFHYVSLAAMMLPTNDGFIALNGVQAPKGRKTVMYLSPGYDAGSEENDELCAYIPGPFGCDNMGEPYNSNDDAEGYVHIHAGIHGIGDLDAAVYDWRNPVARVVIKRVIIDDEEEDDDDD